MISFEDLLSHYIIAEAISLRNAKKKMLSKKYSGAYNDRLNEIFGDKNRLISRITIDYSNMDSPLMKKINSLLYHQNYSIDGMSNYIKGIAFKVNDKTMSLDKKNPVKIGKLLQKYEPDGEIETTDRKDGEKTTKRVVGKPLLHEFKNDPMRSSNGEFLLVISRHPYDIAGASTDRSWTSCMDLGLPRINYPKTKQNTGINKKYIPKDIDEGTLVAYVVTMNELYEGPNGDEKVKLQKPLSRILMKPHNSDVGSVYTVGTMYGSKYPEFYQKIKEWVSKNLNNRLKGGEKVYKNRNLYNDGDVPVDFEFNTGNEIADKVVNELLEYSNEKELGNQITFETSSGDYVTNVNLKLVFDFNSSVHVREFEYLNNIYSLSDNIPSKYERLVGNAIFSHLKSRGGRGYNDGSPNITVTSLGDGIEIEIECNVQVRGEEDKYIDDDYIWGNIYYPLEWMKNLNYSYLKRELYKIVKNYDWKAHDDAVTNQINEALELYKNTLDNFPKFYPKGNISFQSLEVISPLRILKWEDSAIKVLHNDLYYTVRAFETLSDHMSMIERPDRSIYRDTRYTETKMDICYEWFKRTFGVDLAEYKNKTEQLWSAKILIDLYVNAKDSGKPIPTETFELLKDVDEEQDKIIRYIRRLIGYKGEIKL